MKKFLRITQPHSAKEVPLALDAQILASAAMQARSIRKKRFIFKLTLPAVAAAAAVAAVTVGTFQTIDLNELPAVPASSLTVPVVEVAKQEILPPPPQNVENSAELLALADTTILEQESYNLAAMADFSVDGDSITI